MYLEKKAKWDNYSLLDETLKQELKNMSEEEIKEAFTNDLSFGTAGIRGILGAGTARMNYYVVRKATRGFGQYLAKLENALTRGVVIAHDNRRYSKEFALDSAKVLTNMGFKVYLFKDLRPTPQLSFALRHLGCIGGIMITASHNPKEYNGYKIYDESGCQTLPDEASKVVEEINSITDYFNIEVSNNEDNIIYLDESLDTIYCNEVSSIVLNPNLNKEFNVVYTPLHGTGLVFADKLLKENGYNCFPYQPQMINDPNFSNVDSSNPEEEKAYTRAISYAKEVNADLVLATDPDADRLGVVVKHNNEFVLLNGNQTAILTVEYILKNLKQQNKLPKDGYVFSTNVSSNLPITIAHKYGLKSFITLTGFKFIGEQARLLENKEGTYVFGFEESYGSLIKDFVRDKDAMQAILMACEMHAYYKEQNKTLIDALNDIYEEYGYSKEGITNFVLTGLVGAEKINRILDFFRNNEIDLADICIKEDNLLQVKTIYSKEIKKEVITLPKSNVIKYIFSDGSNFVLRPSGTEPKLKVYYNIIGTSSDDVNNKLEQLKEKVLSIINSIE